MPIAPFLPAIFQGGASVASFIKARKNKLPKFENTPLGRRLNALSREGEFTKTARSNIIGQASRRAGDIAGVRTSNIRGYLEARGYGNSIAGVRELGRPGRDQQRSVFEATKNIETRNELSKQRAKTDFARASTQQNNARRLQNRNDFNALVHGLAGAGSQAATAFSQMLKEKGRAAEEAIEKASDEEFEMMQYEVEALILNEDMEGAIRKIQEFTEQRLNKNES